MFKPCFLVKYNDPDAIKAFNYMASCRCRSKFSSQFEIAVLVDGERAGYRSIALFSHPIVAGLKLPGTCLRINAAKLMGDWVPRWVETPFRLAIMPDNGQKDRWKRMECALDRAISTYLAWNCETAIVPWGDQEYMDAITPDKQPQVVVWRDAAMEALYPKHCWAIA